MKIALSGLRSRRTVSPGHRLRIHAHGFYGLVVNVPVIKDRKVPSATKPALLQPGADKLCNLFGIDIRYAEAVREEDWNGRAAQQ